MKISRLNYLVLAVFILFSLTAFHESEADDISRSAGFNIGCKGWSRGTPADEKESEGWVFYNCEKGKMDDADTMAVIFWDYVDVKDKKNIDSFYKALKDQYVSGYPNITFQPYLIDGKEVELGTSYDDEGGTLYTLTFHVKDRLYNIIAVKFGRHTKMPDDLKRLFASIRTVKEPSKSIHTIKSADLTAASLVFRRSAARSFDKAVRSFGGENAFDLMLNKTIYRKNSDAWSMLFNGSYMLFSAPGQQNAVTCYYNPLFDTAVLVRWKINTSRIISIDSASLLTGTWQNGLTSHEFFSPRWIMNSSKPETAIFDQTKAFIRLFEEKFPPESKSDISFPGQASPALVQSVFDMCRMQMEALVALQDPQLKEIQKCIGDFRSAFVRGNKASLDSMIPEANPVRARELLSLPAEWRSGAVPVFIMPGSEKTCIFLGNDITPGSYVIICINRSGRPSISSAGVLYQSGIKGGK